MQAQLNQESALGFGMPTEGMKMPDRFNANSSSMSGFVPASKDNIRLYSCSEDGYVACWELEV